MGSSEWKSRRAALIELGYLSSEELSDRGLQAEIDAYACYLESEHWRKLRYRMGLWPSARVQTCAACGTPHGSFELHHLTYARLGSERDEDLLILCKQCHSDTHQEVRAGTDLHQAHLPVRTKKLAERAFREEEIFARARAQRQEKEREASRAAAQELAAMQEQAVLNEKKAVLARELSKSIRIARRGGDLEHASKLEAWEMKIFGRRASNWLYWYERARNP